MAELADRYEDNVIGRYFVDTQCIDCDLCRETAPNNFTRQTEEACKEAMENCPVEAIGDFGPECCGGGCHE